MPRRLATTLCLAAGCLATAGCLFNADGERIVRGNEERTSVAFESEQGLVDFQSTVRARNTYSARRQGENAVAIPFILSIDQTLVLSSDAFYNDEVCAADINGDGTLSDAEVRAYCAN